MSRYVKQKFNDREVREVSEVRGGLWRSEEVRGGPGGPGGPGGQGGPGSLERSRKEFQEVFKIIPWGQLHSTLDNFNFAGVSNVMNSILQI